MKLLLDTNTFIWLIGRDIKRVGVKAHQHIAEAEVIYVSSITVFEINIKTMLKKLKLPSEDITQAVTEMGSVSLPMTARHAETVKQFPELVRHDPFDRMLLAQAKTENLTLLTVDRILLDLHLPYVVNAQE